MKRAVGSRLCYVLCTLIVVAVASIPVFAITNEVKPIEATMAYTLFTTEKSVRSVPPDAEGLLRSAIDDATKMAANAAPHPETREQALMAFEAIQLALIKHNFLQPPEQKDWPQTIGIALTPHSFPPDELRQILSFSPNARRRANLDPAKPFYYVDCDMGSQFFLAVGERLGWDIRLVELPQHNFVRWHLSNSTKINWDWVAGSSIEDDSYRGAVSPAEDIRYGTLYLRSLEPAQARAYYLGLIGSEATNPSEAERLLQEAIAILPNHPLTQNNLAWLYATHAEFAKTKSSLAVHYSLAAWSTQPDHGNFADTAACSLAANGNKTLAVTIEQFAIEHPDNSRERDSFRKNLARITAGELCQ